MPNWKSYESSVRLLSAIVAAHPELKLNYNDVGRFYGGGTTYKSVWGRMTQISKHAKILQDAVANGVDPLTIELDDSTQKGKSDAKDIAARFGGDCTKSALENRFRRLKSDAVLINKWVDNGIDPINMNVGDTDGAIVMKGKEVAAHFDNDTTAKAISHQIAKIKIGAKRLRVAKSAGTDPGLVQLSWTTGSSGSDIAAHFGSKATPAAIRNQMDSTVKPDAKQLRAAVACNQDADQVQLRWLSGKNSNEVARCYGSEATASAIQNIYKRNIRPDVKAIHNMLETGRDPKHVVLSWQSKGVNEIVRYYGSDANKKSIINHFDRDLKPNIKALSDAVGQGHDPKNVVLVEGVRSGKHGKQISRCYGGGLKSGALSKHFDRHIKPGAKLIREAVTRGEDPEKTVPFDADIKSSRDAKEVSRIFGSDSTPNGLRFQFTDRIKPLAKAQLEMANRGGDPKDLDLKDIKGGKDHSIAIYLNDGTTASAIEHRFRPVKKEAAEMKAAIANSFGEGISENSGGSGVKAKATPRKRAPKSNKGTPLKNGDATDDDGNGYSCDDTPSKKSKNGLNKVASGRVVKTPNRARGPAMGYAELDDPDNSDDEIVKDENDEPFSGMYGSPQRASNGNNNGANGNGVNAYHGESSSFDHVEDDDQFFESEI